MIVYRTTVPVSALFGGATLDFWEPVHDYAQARPLTSALIARCAVHSVQASLFPQPHVACARHGHPQALHGRSPCAATSPGRVFHAVLAAALRIAAIAQLSPLCMADVGFPAAAHPS